jgi:hypothetical protein
MILVPVSNSKNEGSVVPYVLEVNDHCIYLYVSATIAVKEDGVCFRKDTKDKY